MKSNKRLNSKQKSEYKEGFKSTALFGGIQVYSIIIRVIKSKFIAILLGTGGMGISNLLRSTTDLVSVATNCGLRTSGVRTVADAYSKNDPERIAKVTAALRRLISVTGLIGLLIVAFFATFWSDFAFGTSDYIWYFVIVSAVVLLDQLANGENVVLQGMRQRQLLAKANLIGSTLGLLISVPLYYIYGIKAIPFVMVIGSIVNYGIAYFYARKTGIKHVSITFAEIKIIGYPIIKLGFFLSLQAILQQLCAYLVRIFVSNVGGLDQVGLYSAGTAILTTYIGLVFTAMATDYFPRLAATKDNEELSTRVMQQTEIALLLLTPLIVAFLIFIKPLIILLYSSKFLPIEAMLYWGMAATLFKAMAWGLSLTLLAKADSKAFFFNELIAIAYSFALNIIGYYYWGLTGFGLSMIFTYILYLVQMHFVVREYFGIVHQKQVWILFLKLSVPLIISLILVYFSLPLLKYIIGSGVLVLTLWYVFTELDKRIEIKQAISRFFKRNK